MYTKNPYQAQYVQSLSNAEVCQMLWQKVGDNLGLAQEYIDEGAMEQKLERINRSFEIFNFLSINVATFLPAQVAESHRSLLEVLGAQLASANSKNDQKALQRIQEIAYEQSRTWKEVLEVHKASSQEDVPPSLAPGPVNVKA